MRFKHFLTENIILPDESIINTVISHLISVRLRHKSLDVNKLEELLSQNKAKIGFRYTPNESPNDSYPYGFNRNFISICRTGYRGLPRKPRGLAPRMNWQNNFKNHSTNSKYDSILYM